jgi:hypothetical protein
MCMCMWLVAFRGIVTAMAHDGILAFLADRLRAPHEVLATEGLCYLLGRYPAARHAVVTALATDAISLETRKKISFASQTRGDGDTAIVDLEGQVGRQVFLSIEGKFGALLQPSQPTDYARRLEPGGSLLFVCPSWRSFRLCRELRERSAGALLLADGAGWKPDDLGIMWIALTERRRLGVTSWDSLLGVARGRSGEMPPDFDSDIRQLEGLVARFEQDLMPWTARELKSGAAGLAFAKALLTTRELCGAVADQLGRATTPSWRTFASTARTASDVEDWYGTVIRVAGASLDVGFMPVVWGEDGVRTPLRLWIRAGDLSREAIDRLYPAYLQMLEISNGLLLAMLDAPPVSAAAEHERWWMVPFPLRPDIAGTEARGDIKETAAALMAPLIELDLHTRQKQGNT